MYWIKRVGPYALVLTIVVILLRQIDPAQVLRMLAAIDWRWLLAAAGAYVLTNLVRALRFNALLGLHSLSVSSRALVPAAAAAAERGKAAGEPGRVSGGLISALQLMPEMFALSFLNNTLPSRSGELSFPYFMWRRRRVAIGESTAALIVVRIFDYMAVALLYVLCASANLHRLTSSATTAVWAVSMLLIVSLALLLLAPWLGQRVLDSLDWLARRTGLERRRLVHALLSVGQQVVDHFRKICSIRLYAITLGWSLLTWIGTFGWFAASMQGIGVGQPFGLVVVGATFASLAKAVPFITVGGFGAHEAGWTIGFSLVGMPLATAIASGFAVNILTLLMSVVFGGPALIFMQTQEKWLARDQANRRQAQALGVVGAPAPDDRLTP